MQSIILMDAECVKQGELAQFQSLRLERSYYGVGSFELTTDPKAACALSIVPDVILFPAGAPEKAMLAEEITWTRGRVTVKGCMLKGLAKRRIAVAPMTLPARLWRYNGAAWVAVTDAGVIRAALLDEAVYQGFEKPLQPTSGMLFLDMTELATVYDWGSGMGLGEVVSDLGVATLRSKYQNFGWDRFMGGAEDAYLHFAANNLTAAEDEKRIIPELTLGGPFGGGDASGVTLPWQARFDKLEALFESIGEATGVGWDIRPDLANGGLLFGAWAGRDLSEGGTVALLSENMGNVTNVVQKEAHSGSATTVYVGGAGEDENRFVLNVGGAAQGLVRRETWAEAGSIDDADMLSMYGQNKLDAAAPKRTLTAELVDSGACRYGRDYDVGDRVIVRGPYGEMATRVTSVTETYERGVRTLSAVFGDAPVSVSGVLRRGNGAAR